MIYIGVEAELRNRSDACEHKFIFIGMPVARASHDTSAYELIDALQYCVL